MDRKDLEIRAGELKIKFPANIGDAKLAEKIAAAEAEQADTHNGGSADAGSDASQDHGAASSDAAGEQAPDASGNSAGDDTTPGDTSAASLGDQQTSDAVVSDAASDTSDTAPTDAGSVEFAALPEGTMLNVNCAIKGGRRRAGRRWAGGVTKVNAGELTADQFEELLADPMLQVTPAAPSEDE